VIVRSRDYCSPRGFKSRWGHHLSPAIPSPSFGCRETVERLRTARSHFGRLRERFAAKNLHLEHLPGRRGRSGTRRLTGSRRRSAPASRRRSISSPIAGRSRWASWRNTPSTLGPRSARRGYSASWWARARCPKARPDPTSAPCSSGSATPSESVYRRRRLLGYCRVSWSSCPSAASMACFMA
jgi:hypothetical protein